MKKALEILLNRIFKKDIELLYGDGCYVIVYRVYLSEYQKCYIVDCKLMIPTENKVDDFNEIYPEGFKYIVNESWKYMAVTENIQFLSSVDFF
jgi:hypothetical protein